MSDWFHNLPIVWMALLVFGFTYLLSALIYFVVTVLAVGDRARAFKSVSQRMLPPLGIILAYLLALRLRRFRVMAPAPPRRSTVRLAH
jgi:hypothetical protein